MNEAKFLVDDDLPEAPKHSKRGTLFTMQFRQQGDASEGTIRAVILLGLAVIGSINCYLHEYAKCGMLMLGLACLVLLSMMRGYDWLGILTRQFFVLLNWASKVWKVAAEGGRQDNDQLRFSEQMKAIIDSGWFLGLGIGPMFFALLSLGMGWLSIELASGVSAAFIVVGAALASWMLDQSASESSPQGTEKQEQQVRIVGEEDAATFLSSHVSDQGLVEQGRDAVIEDPLGDDVAVPFAQKPTEDSIAQALKQDLDAAIEGIDPTLVASAEVDLAASNKQLLGELESSRVTTVLTNQLPSNVLDTELESLKDSVQSALSSVS